MPAHRRGAAAGLARRNHADGDAKRLCGRAGARDPPLNCTPARVLRSTAHGAWLQALNGLANAFAQAAGRWPPPRPLQPSDDLRPVSLRPAGLVFDYVPLIHRDTRLVGWGAAAHRRVNGTRCPRLLTAADGGRRARWRVWAQEATANATARLAERPWRWTYV